MEIPDFRDPSVRERFRTDDGAMKRPFDPAKIFPAGHDPKRTSQFTALMLRLLRQSTLLREACDGAVVFDQVKEEESRIAIIDKLTRCIGSLAEFSAARQQAEELIAAYPDCPAAEALRSVLTLGEMEFRGGCGALHNRLHEIREKLSNKRRDV